MIGQKKESAVRAFYYLGSRNAMAREEEPGVRTPCEVRHSVGPWVSRKVCVPGEERHALPVTRREAIQR
eukprot:1032790-Alexandrium_andersonii.AAC.1